MCFKTNVIFSDINRVQDMETWKHDLWHITQENECYNRMNSITLITWSKKIPRVKHKKYLDAVLFPGLQFWGFSLVLTGNQDLYFYRYISCQTKCALYDHVLLYVTRVPCDVRHISTSRNIPEEIPHKKVLVLYVDAVLLQKVFCTWHCCHLFAR